MLDSSAFARARWAAPALIGGGTGVVVAVSPHNLIVVCALAGVFGLWLGARERLFGAALTRPFALALLAVLAVGTLSAGWAHAPEDALVQAATALALVLPVLVLMAGMDRLDPRVGRATLTWLLGGMVFALGVLTVDLATDNALRAELRSWVGEETSPWVLNRSLTSLGLMAWPCLIVLVARGAPVWAVGGVALVVLGYGLAAHATAAWLGLAVGYGVCAVALVAPRLAIGGVAVALVAVVTVFPVAVLEAYASDAVMARLRAGDFSSALRLEIWEQSVRAALDRPLAGWGLDNARHLIAPDVPSRAVPDQPRSTGLHPHNVFLQLWLELGVAGYLGFLALTGTVLGAVARLPGPARAFGLGAYAHALTVMLVAYDLWQAWWIACMVLLAAFVHLAAIEGERVRRSARE